jgi:hypothetical protein
MQVLLDSEGIDAWDQVCMSICMLLTTAGKPPAEFDFCPADRAVQHTDLFLGCPSV